MAGSVWREGNTLSTAALSQWTWGEIQNNGCLGMKLLTWARAVARLLKIVVLFPPQNTGFSAGGCALWWIHLNKHPLKSLHFIISAENELHSDSLQRKHSKPKAGSSYVPQLSNWPGSHSRPVLPPILPRRKSTNPWRPLLAKTLSRSRRILLPSGNTDFDRFCFVEKKLYQRLFLNPFLIKSPKSYLFITLLKSNFCISQH